MRYGYDILYFSYDANGVPQTVTHNTTLNQYTTVYQYVTNQQCDVIGIQDYNGNVYASYSYNAWGVPTSSSDSSSHMIEVLNPLRYRGYVYDQETGLYYLQSRYYNPRTGRFLNADKYASTGQGILGNNAYAYCNNNAVNAFDPVGEDAIWLQDKDAVLGFGHTGLLIQDANGVWYHFYWGNTGTGGSNKKNAQGRIHSLGGFVYKNRSSLNSYLKKNKIYSGKYEDLLYLKGNFSKSVEYAKSLSRNYNLLWDNCMQVSIEVLCKGKFTKSNSQYKAFLNKISLNPIPNMVFNRLLSFDAAIKIYHKAPWYLRIFCVSPSEAVLLY